MAYTVLARRYRSSTFDEVIGQEHVAQTLKKAIASGRIAHAYLFCGTRGVGKTSMARIMAKSLNCEKFDAPTTTPCGKCNSCTAIARGDDIDVIEIDAASNTGVDNVRDIIANAAFRPARSRFKVYIIDEVHMLSKAAFNALLKIMEEPPEHVKFILATTEPEKVLPTILSRCQRYDFRSIGTREIADHLKDICKSEKIKAEDDALLLVAKAGAGSMRDALSLLDRLLSLGEKSLTVEMIEQLLGLPKTQLVFDLAEAIGSGDVKSTLSRADAMLAGGLSADALIAALVEHLRNLLILRTCGADSKLVEVPGLPIANLAKQAEQFDPPAISQDIVILEELRRQMRSSQAGRALLDATLARLALADQFSSIADLLAASGGGAATGGAAGQKKKFEPLVDVAAASPIHNEPTPDAVPATAVSPAPPVVDAQDEDDDLPRPGKVWENSGPSLKELLAQQSQSKPDPAPPPAATNDSNIEPVPATDLPRVWQSLLDALQDEIGISSILSHGRLGEIDDGQAVIRYSANQDTLSRMLDKNERKKELIRVALSRVIGSSIGVRFEIDPEDAAAESSGGTATATITRPATSNPASTTAVRREIPRPVASPSPADVNVVKITPELTDSLRQDPLIRAIMDDFGAQIVRVENNVET